MIVVPDVVSTLIVRRNKPEGEGKSIPIVIAAKMGQDIVWLEPKTLSTLPEQAISLTGKIPVT